MGLTPSTKKWKHPRRINESRI